MPAIGLTLDRTTHMLPAQELADLALKIEQLGFDSVWLLDSFGRDPYMACAYMLSKTSKLKVATGVATAYSRDAMGAQLTAGFECRPETQERTEGKRKENAIARANMGSAVHRFPTLEHPLPAAVGVEPSQRFARGR